MTEKIEEIVIKIYIISSTIHHQVRPTRICKLLFGGWSTDYDVVLSSDRDNFRRRETKKPLVLPFKITSPANEKS